MQMSKSLNIIVNATSSEFRPIIQLQQFIFDKNEIMNLIISPNENIDSDLFETLRKFNDAFNISDYKVDLECKDKSEKIIKEFYYAGKRVKYFIAVRTEYCFG